MYADAEKSGGLPPTPLPPDVTFVSFIGVLRRIDNGGTAATSTLIVLERILETAAVFFTIFTISSPPHRRFSARFLLLLLLHPPSPWPSFPRYLLKLYVLRGT